MRRSVFIIGFAVAISLIGMAKNTYAASLKVAPDSYKTTLKSGERQKGFIDISNPTEEKVVVATSVQAFRQVDDQGNVEFYDNDQVSKGIQLDLKKFELRPHDVIRMYFILDGKKLPSGDVFGAVFFTTSSGALKTGVNQAVRVGTLFSIVNGTPGPRKATITGLKVPFFQAGTSINGSVSVMNTANEKHDTGFYPDITMKVWPGNSTRVITSSLVFAGRTRSTDFALKDIGIGLHKITVSYKGSTKTAWVLTAEPFTLIVIGVILGTVLLETIFWLRRKTLRKNAAHS